MMNINWDKITNKLLDIKRDIVTVSVETIICEEPTDDMSIWCAKTIKNISRFVANMSIFLTNLEMEKDGLMAVLQKYMEDNGVKQALVDDLVIKIKRNPPRLHVTDLSKIDDKYYYEQTETKLDKQLITKDIKEGLHVEGCELVQDNRLEIKYQPIKAKEHV